ncbi:DUF7937 domain-containing protein [Isoptericola aurantiacus]|uniref:DUF7937 domain-containing protein n=1 Tax=Isoptericola aurantiacus TaxID=3377839 RepID=UPI00383A2F62
MPDVAGAVRRSPFAGASTRDVVRDVVAVVAMLVALPMPWDLGHRGSDLLWVVLTTVLAVLAVAAPYAARADVLRGAGARFAEPTTRLLCLVPYAVVGLLYLVLDVVRSAGDAGYVGGGLALGLAGVVLAAAVPGTRAVIVAAVVLAAGAVATPLVGVVQGATWPGTVGSVLAALLVLGLLWLTVWRFLHDDEAAGMVLVALGAAVALELAILGGGSAAAWFESLHGGRYGLLLLPVVAAAAVPVALDRAVAAAGEAPEASARRWVRVAVQAFELTLLVAAFVALVAVVRLVGIGFSAEAVLRLVVGVLVVVVASLARRALLRDARSGHATAVGAACVIVVLGVVVLIARAGVGTASRLEELLLALALPGLVLGALLLPPSVRAVLAADPPAEGSVPAGEPEQWQQPGGGQDAAWQVQAPDAGDQAWQEPAAQQTAVQDPVVAGHSWQPPAAEEDAVTSATEAQGSRWRGTWADGTDATQQMSPVRPDVAGDGQQTAQVHTSAASAWSTQSAPSQAQPVQRTQVLQPVADVPGSPWTSEQALDPGTPLEQLAQIVQEAPHLRPHVAANPSTYPALLDWLGALGDPAVDAALRTRR